MPTGYPSVLRTTVQEHATDLDDNAAIAQKADVTLTATYAASGAIAVTVTGAFANWPADGVFQNLTTLEFIRYQSKTGNDTLNCDANSRGRAASTPTAGAVSQVIRFVEGHLPGVTLNSMLQDMLGLIGELGGAAAPNGLKGTKATLLARLGVALNTDGTLNTSLAYTFTGAFTIAPVGDTTALTLTYSSNAPASMAITSTLLNGNKVFQLGALPGSPTYGALWLGNVVASSTNYTLRSNNVDNVQLNTPGTLYLGVSNTAVVGITAGTVQAMQPVQLVSSGSNAAAAINFGTASTGLWGNSSTVVVTAGGVAQTATTTNSLLLKSSAVLGFSASDPSTTPADTGVARNAAGVVEFNNGTAGTLRDITLRNFTASGTISVNSSTGSATQVMHGGATPTWSAVSLTTDITGVLPGANGGTNDANALTAWTTSWVPTISSDAGGGNTTTFAATQAYWKSLGKTVWFTVTIQRTSAGNMAAYMTFTLPTSCHGQTTFVAMNQTNNNGCVCYCAGAGNLCYVLLYNAGVPFTSGQYIIISGVYEQP